MRTVDGVVNIDNSVADTNEELNIIINRDKAAYYNISANNVYQTISLALKLLSSARCCPSISSSPMSPMAYMMLPRLLL